MKEDSQAAVKEDSQADVKDDSKVDVKEDSQADAKEDSQADVEENSEAAVKEYSKGAVKKKEEDKNLTEKQAELLPVKTTLKRWPCTLGLKVLRSMGRTENYKGTDQDSEAPKECFSPFMTGVPFGNKKPLPR